MWAAAGRVLAAMVTLRDCVRGALGMPGLKRHSLASTMLALCLHVAIAAAAEGLLQVEVDRSTGAYTVELAGQPWLQSGALRFFVNGEWHGVSPTALLPSPPLPTHRTVHSLQRDPAVPVVTGRLKLQSTPSEPINGTDRFGPYSKLTFDWLAISSKGATTGFSTSIRSYLDGRTAVFEQSVPDGAMHTNYKNVSFVDVGRQQATTEPFPFLHFPSFNTTATNSIFATVGRAGYVGWNGTFVYQHYGAGPPISEGLGLSSGPIVIFDGLENAGGDHAVVISPATHFKGATMMRWEEDWVVGLSGEITHVPAEFLHETILVAGEGVTATVDYYGRKMRAAFHTNKLPDPVVDKVGYWTDNGAYYYGDTYWQPPFDETNPDFNLTCCNKAKLLAAKAALDKDKVSMNYLQLDDWWYHGPHPVRNFTGVKCVQEWKLPEDTYPGGLASLRQQYGAPFLLYGPYFCENNQWQQRLIPQGADAGVPPPEDSERFYTQLFEYVRAHGGIGYEVDFMSNLYLGIPEFRRTLDASTEWQAGMNAAGLATNITIQFCMMQPSDLLNSLQFDAVTNGRASNDYAEPDNWQVGGASLLFWAVGMRPSKDNFWSGDGHAFFPGRWHDNSGTNGELNAMLATMSTGPVGPSDGAGRHNATRLLRTCTTDGTILQPEKPFTPIDASYRQVLSPIERQLRSAAVWSTYSQAKSNMTSEAVLASSGRAVQYHIIAVESQGDVPLFGSDLYPTPPAGAVFAVRDWHRSAKCVDGLDAVATGCIRTTTGQAGDPLVTLDQGMHWPHGNYTTQLYTATLLMQGAFTLLGELDKFVPLSSKRFSAVESTLESLTATLSGKPGEIVHLTALKPQSDSWVVATADVKIGLDGHGQANIGHDAVS